MSFRIFLCFCFAVMAFPLFAQTVDDDTNPTGFSRQRNVIYGHKYGMSLTMDVFTPADARGLAVLWVVSGSGRSSVDRIDKPSYQRCFRILLHKGYTVFAVVHSSAPRFTLQDMVPDIHRAVRFVRSHAQDFGIQADRIGIAGASAGGFLALLMGTTGKDGDPDHADEIERVSGRVQAVGCFFAPSDWLDFDGKGTDVRTYQKDKYGSFDPSFRFYELDPDQHTPAIITDEQKILSLLKTYSPVAQVTRNAAPVLIIHGDADPFIPWQQSRGMIKTLKAHNVPSRLITRPGKGHGWDGWENETAMIADWFDEHLWQGQ